MRLVRLTPPTPPPPPPRHLASLSGWITCADAHEQAEPTARSVVQYLARRPDSDFSLGIETGSDWMADAPLYFGAGSLGSGGGYHCELMFCVPAQALQVLRGEDESIVVGGDGATKPVLFDACDLEDYSSSRYLNDLSRHRELALEQ